MTISELNQALSQLDELTFLLPDGTQVPAHAHVTEVGKITRDFIDCGGTQRKTEVANIQLWSADDIDHRLKPSKLRGILTKSDKLFQLSDLEVEVEFQGSRTIEKYALAFDGKFLRLTSTSTACLAPGACAVPEASVATVPVFTVENNACTPGSGCC